jgi:hypothetical protein
MNRCVLSFVIVFSVFVFAPSRAHAGVAAPQASSQPPITNSDVIGMLKAGVAVNSILSTIDHANKKAFDLSKEGRAQLEAAGATSEMIDVMRGRRKLPKSVREAPVQPIPFVPTATTAAVPAQASASAASAPAPRSVPAAAPAASSSPAAHTTVTVKLPLAAIEIKHFTQAEGLGLTPEFMSIYHGSLLAAMPKMKVAARVVDDGGSISDAEATNAVVAEGRMVALKKGGMVGRLGLEISLYRRSDHTLVRFLTTEVPFKVTPLTKDKHIADATGANTATEIQRALKKG